MGLLRRKREIQEPVINITPLVDVVFVVLIAFIIVAPLLEKDEVQLAPSGGAASHHQISAQESSPVQIHVLANNTILFLGSSVTIEELRMKLLGIRRKYPHAKAQVFHDKRANFGTYQSLKNCLEGAGFEEMDIVLAPS